MLRDGCGLLFWTLRASSLMFEISFKPCFERVCAITSDASEAILAIIVKASGARAAWF